MADGTIIIDTKIDNSGAEKGTRNLKSEAAKLASEYKKAGMDSSTAWKKAWSEIRKNSSNGSDRVKGNLDSISSVAKKCAAVIGGLFILDKVKDYTVAVAKTGVAYNAMAEQSQVAWSTILGSSEKATKMMKDIENYAARTPFSKMGVDAMAKQLSNAGFKGQALFDQLTKFGDMGSAFGVQEDSLKEMVRQYAQVQQAQVAYTEDLNILQDRGIPIYKALGEVMGVPVSQVKKLASEGKVTADVYNKAIDSMSNKTKGAMEDQSKTFNGMVSTLKDNLTILAGALSKPLFEKMKGGLQELMPKLEEFTKLVGSEGISAAVNQVFPQLSPLVDLFINIGTVLSTVVLPALMNFGSFILNNIGPISILVTEIGALAIAFKSMSIIMSIISFVKELKGAMALLKVATFAETAAQYGLNIAMLACPITWIVGLIMVLVGAFIYLWNTSEGFRNFWIGMWESIKTFFINCWNGIINFFTVTIPGWIENIKNWFIGLPAWFGQLWESVKTWFVTKWNDIWDYLFTNIPIWIESIITWFNELPYKIGYALGVLLASIVKWGIETWNYFVTNIPIWIDNIVNWFGELPGRIWAWLCRVIDRIVEWGKNLKDRAVNAVKNTIEKIGEWFGKLPGRVWDWLCRTVNKVVEFGGNLFKAGAKAGARLVESIINAVKSIPEKMASIGRNIVEGLWNGIVGMGSWIADKVSGFFSGIVDGAKSVLGIHSPSRVFEKEIGQYLLPGVGVGVDKTMPDLQENMKDKMLSLTKEMKAKVQFETNSLGATLVAKNTGEISSDIGNNDKLERPFILRLVNKNYLDGEEIAGHTTEKVIENINDSQESYTISTGGVLSFV